MIPKIKPIPAKQLKQMAKNRGAHKNKEWRDAVLARDNKKCQFPNCSQVHNLEVHHIRRYADAPHLRYSLYNGITLCEKCHRRIYAKEKMYELMFFQITIGKMKNDKGSSGHSGTESVRVEK